MSIVADKGKEEKGYQLSAVVIHKDSPITKIEDLKGKKVGVTSIGSAGHYMIGNILEKHGMSLKDIELISMNSTRAQMESLKGKNVDAVMLLSSNIAITLKEGYGKVLANVADEMSYQSTAILTSPKFTADKDVAERFMRAYIKGTRYYHDAVLTKKDGQLVKGQNYDEVVKNRSQIYGAAGGNYKGIFPLYGSGCQADGGRHQDANRLVSERKN